MAMKSQSSILRLKRFQVEEKTRQLARLDAMIAEFIKIVKDLDMQIKHEEQKSGVSDPANYAYPTFAKAALVRKENLTTSLGELKEQRAGVRLALIEQEEELAKAEKMLNKNTAAQNKTKPSAKPSAKPFAKPIVKKAMSA